MKLLSNLRNRLRKNLVNNKRGQGATEYILLLVVVVGLVMVFGPKIKSMVGDKMESLSQDVQGVTTDI
ncbi:Flp1 family type IVb pilin [Pseudobdellovibrio exovorus]|uniref:Uncharacterized protein n=1 Tax=Pseudobdellovibrio exovorus JSS TaxID=1184267 RepID=M4VB23_9BACT|nr:Flp1 family type IVb pilin [Pseudobdellovibrio exovorus]AGH96582.1 hypothetical protein A11Q_2366 [Pseudobdellovibrio exovorus JSS]